MPAGLRRLAPGVAPLALVAIALTQIALAHVAALSPWKGGGYGMFSTTDHGGARRVRIVALTGSGERRGPIPPLLTNRVFRTRDLPTAGALEGLAREVVRRASPPLVDVARVRIEVWRVDYELRTLEPRAVELRRLVVELP